MPLGTHHDFRTMHCWPSEISRLSIRTLVFFDSVKLLIVCLGVYYEFEPFEFQIYVTNF